MNDDFLQIPGYKPRWINDTAAFREAHRSVLTALAGRTIAATFVLWDLQRDEHFTEGPVVLVVDGLGPVEVCANKFDELSLTLGLIDIDQPVRWDWDEEPWHFEWRRDSLATLREVAGCQILSVEVLENDLVVGETHTWCLGGIELVTTAGDLHIFNGLDNTRVAMPREDESGWRRVAPEAREA